jgi:biopolymer transport protein ExbD
MHFRRHQVRPQHETIITLIDVVFFLLVFFMLVGRMDATSPFELSPPISANGDSLPSGGVTVSLAVDGRLALDGVEQPRGEIVERLRDLVSLSNEPLLVRINTHADAPVRYLLRLVTALEGLAKGDVVLVVTPKAR